MGIKALAIYRDNCKVGQPLSDAKAKSADAAVDEVAPVIEYRPVRKRLPKKRPSSTVSFSVGGAEGYMTAGSYPDDGLGEVFLKLGKQGSTLAGVMDAFSIAISIALQYGVPLEAYVSKFVNMRFEPAGLTDDADIRMAQSVMDYIFRRLALDYLDYDKRAGLGIFTAESVPPRWRHLVRRAWHRSGGTRRRWRNRRRGHRAARDALAVGPGREPGDDGRRAWFRRHSWHRGSGALGCPLLGRAAGDHHRQDERRAAVHDLRHQDASRRLLLRLRRLRKHQRLQLSERPGRPLRLRSEGPSVVCHCEE
jgi:hypothetical protein